MSSSVRRSRDQRPVVLLHVGEPKTATTFVQHALRAGRVRLGERGVRVPGAGQHAVFRAAQDLRGIEQRADDPAPSWDGSWDRLARQAMRTQRVSVISHELLCAADDEHVTRAIASLRGADVHVVLTVRDMASLLPAEWQETVKHRNTRGWDDWLADVIDKEAGEFGDVGSEAGERRRDFWFWRVHDTAHLLELWHRHVPRSHIHVVTVPPRGADRGLVWQRFAQLLDVPADTVDVSALRGNESLGLAEVELLRRLNSALSPTVPGWFYMANVKEPLAHGVLARRPSHGRLELPADRLPWARRYADHLTGYLRGAGYDIVGDLADLHPVEPDRPGLHPADVTDDDLLAAAVAASAGLLRRRYQRACAPAGARRRWVGAARMRIRHGIERARVRVQ